MLHEKLVEAQEGELDQIRRVRYRYEALQHAISGVSRSCCTPVRTPTEVPEEIS